MLGSLQPCLHRIQPASCSYTQAQLPRALAAQHRELSRRQRLLCATSALPDDAAQQFLQSINRKKGVWGPAGEAGPDGNSLGGTGADALAWPTDPNEYAKEMLGVEGFNRLERLLKTERQRVWDNIRAAAEERYHAGLMPEWFNPEWLTMREAPTNVALDALQRRLAGLEEPQLDGGSGSGSGAGNNSNSGGGGGGFWREDDPYWPLRDWGDHPMRWWTLVFGALLAAGGFFTYLHGGYLEALQIGFGAGALLAMSAAAMSDMSIVAGHLGVKVAFGVCALLVLKECFCGWQHKRTRGPHRPHLELCGLTSLAMCVMYMTTDMSGLAEVALPTNPGGVFKSPEIAAKNRVWSFWGFNQVQMRA